MEELFWELWYGNNELLSAYSFVSTLLFLAPLLHSGTTNRIIILKSYLIIICIAGVLFGALYFYIDNVNAAERHYNNALRFLNGEDGFSINPDIAMIAFERAGKKGHALAYRYLGEMKMDRDEDFAAIKAWDKAVRLGDAKSACLLGEFYEHTSVALSESRKKELAYIFYSLGGCLGDDALRRRAETLRPKVSPQIWDDAAQYCGELKKSRRK